MSKRFEKYARGARKIIVAAEHLFGKYGLDGTNVNELTHQRLTDMGRAPSFYDCLVEVERAEAAG